VPAQDNGDIGPKGILGLSLQSINPNNNKARRIRRIELPKPFWYANEKSFWFLNRSKIGYVIGLKMKRSLDYKNRRNSLKIREVAFSRLVLEVKNQEP